MKFLHYGKDGGPESTVHGFWIVEIKSLFSIALLRFSNGSRDSYHSHAFNCMSWVLRGRLVEEFLKGKDRRDKTYTPSIKPVMTYRSTFHKVMSKGVTWVFTVRGPWADTWQEYDPKSCSFMTLKNGRIVMENAG